MKPDQTNEFWQLAAEELAGESTAKERSRLDDLARETELYPALVAQLRGVGGAIRGEESARMAGADVETMSRAVAEHIARSGANEHRQSSSPYATPSPRNHGGRAHDNRAGSE